MNAPVILSFTEQEYLLHAIEAAMPVRDGRQFFLRSQGALQALLPHRIMVCLQFGPQDQLQHVECLHRLMLDSARRSRLSHRDHGLALRMARHCRHSAALLPAVLDLAPAVPGGPSGADVLAPFAEELRGEGLDNVLLHASERLPGGWSCFVLFGLPHRPRARQAHFLQLLLPYLHMSLQRIGPQQAQGHAAALARPPSARELEILHWVREGKSNEEIGLMLGISGMTVKNHLQRLYRLLGVSNRAHAIARGMALQLFEPGRTLARAA